MPVCSMCFCVLDEYHEYLMCMINNEGTARCQLHTCGCTEGTEGEEMCGAGGRIKARFVREVDREQPSV